MVRRWLAASLSAVLLCACASHEEQARGLGVAAGAPSLVDYADVSDLYGLAPAELAQAMRFDLDGAGLQKRFSFAHDGAVYDIYDGYRERRFYVGVQNGAIVWIEPNGIVSRALCEAERESGFARFAESPR